MDIFLILIIMFYTSALMSFFLSCAAFSMANRMRANFMLLAACLALFILSWIKLAI